MKYLKLNEDASLIYPYSVGQLRIDNPNTSFPANTNDELLLEYDVHPVYETVRGNDPRKTYTEGIPELIDGDYYQTWIVEDKPTGELNEVINRKWNEVISERNLYLHDSDYTMLEDFPDRATKLQLWKDYRQLLRNITLQPDPFNIVWPTKPI